MSAANTEGMTPDNAHAPAPAPAPTFTRARLRWYAASTGVLIGCTLYAYALWLGALR